MLKRKKLSIGYKIGLGYVLIIILAMINCILGIVLVRKSMRIDREITGIYQPISEKLGEFEFLIDNTRALTNTWIHSPNKEDKVRLNELLDQKYSRLVLDMSGIISTITEDDQTTERLKSILDEAELIVENERAVTSVLASDEDYEVPASVSSAEDFYFKANKKATTLLVDISKLLVELHQTLNTANETKANNYQLIEYNMIALAFVLLVIGGLSSYFNTRNIAGPIKYVHDIIDDLTQGKQPESDEMKITNDEVGEMAQSLHNYVSSLGKVSQFAKDIGSGNLDSDFEALSEDDVLGNALINMRNELKKVNEDEQKRNWVIEGLAKFVIDLRENNHDITLLSDNLISNLVQYMDANQGGIFIHRMDGNEEYLEMTGCYAYERSKMTNRKIIPGEGLLGQCWLEKKTISLSEVPSGYINITSGLGEAPPRYVVIQPLMVNEEMYGVLEIASFNKMEDYQLEFLEKLSESIASTLSSVTINERTQKLLLESKSMSEQLQSQEEELRQNQEEMMATQEEMQRKIVQLESELDKAQKGKS